MSLVVVAEGHGEMEAVRNIVTRLGGADGLDLPFIPRSGGVHRRDIRTRGRVEEACNLARMRGASALLLTRDADNEEHVDEMRDCPKARAPEVAAWVRALELPFPAAVVLFRWEYETMFLAGLESIAGRRIVGDDHISRPGIVAGAAFHGDPDQAPRGAKGWLTQNMPPGVAYKPSTDQLALTRMLQLDDERLNALPSFRRLRRALRFLAAHAGCPGAVYPQEGWQ
jgi:hypothetical protein